MWKQLRHLGIYLCIMRLCHCVYVYVCGCRRACVCMCRCIGCTHARKNARLTPAVDIVMYTQRMCCYTYTHNRLDFVAFISYANVSLFFHLFFMNIDHNYENVMMYHKHSTSYHNRSIRSDSGYHHESRPDIHEFIKTESTQLSPHNL